MIRRERPSQSGPAGVPGDRVVLGDDQIGDAPSVAELDALLLRPSPDRRALSSARRRTRRPAPMPATSGASVLGERRELTAEAGRVFSAQIDLVVHSGQTEQQRLLSGAAVKIVFQRDSSPSRHTHYSDANVLAVTRSQRVRCSRLPERAHSALSSPGSRFDLVSIRSLRGRPISRCGYPAQCRHRPRSQLRYKRIVVGVPRSGDSTTVLTSRPSRMQARPTASCRSSRSGQPMTSSSISTGDCPASPARPLLPSVENRETAGAGSPIPHPPGKAAQPTLASYQHMLAY
jgi:hypothetical protein